MRASWEPHEENQGAAFRVNSPSHSWLGAVGLFVVVGIAYFVASRLGVVLRTESEGLPVFWPAAGVAIGALIALGPNTRLPVAAAVAAATIGCSLIACSLMIGMSPSLAIPFSLINAGQVLLTAWLIERWFGGVFNLDDVPQVLGFLASSAIGAAVAATVVVIAVSFVEPTAFPLNAWRLWFASYLLGTVTVAPPLIGLGEALRKPQPRGELIEGTVGLVILAALSVFFISLPQGPWATALPVAFVFPVLLWIAVRCRPVFAAIAAFVVTTAIFFSITFDMGHFGDASIPLADRILAAQTFVLAGALLTLVLAALFADWRRREAELEADISERKKAEVALAERNIELALATEVGRVGTYAYDTDTEIMQISAGYVAIHGFPEGTGEIARSECLAGVHLEDIKRVGLLRNEAFHERRREYNVEYRIIRAGEVRWVESRCFISYDSDGHPRRVVGVTIDISDRKRVEQALAERTAQLALAARAALVGSYVYDVNKGTTQVAEGYAVIHGLPEGTTETTISEWRARVHPEDLARAEGLREQAFADRRKEDNAEYRIVLSTGEVRWIERRGAISYGECGRPERVVGVNIDVTERKRAEQHQRALNAELDHRVKNTLATVSAIIAQTQEASSSQADFVAGLNSRINSLARTHELLSESSWRGASLEEIVRREFAPYSRGNTKTTGPRVTLRAEATPAVAAVLHELTTNAAKYGALSNRTGHVSVQWWWPRNGSRDRLFIDWQETGSPPVVTPRRSGYGTAIIRELIPFELGGVVELSFAAEGTRCRLEIPGEWTSRDRSTTAEARLSDPALSADPP